MEGDLMEELRTGLDTGFPLASESVTTAGQFQPLEGHDDRGKLYRERTGSRVSIHAAAAEAL
jgi:hypothetical protein